MSEVPAVRITVSPTDMFTALGDALWAAIGEQPKRESVLCLEAQWQVENSSSVTCYNVANQRHHAGSAADYCVLPYCSEIERDGHEHYYARDAAAQASLAARGHVAVIAPERCQFAAYASLEDGAKAYLALLQTTRYAGSWAAMLAGSPQAFAHALRVNGWYTANEAKYTASLVSRFNALDQSLPSM